jgi:hypothetical protein
MKIPRKRSTRGSKAVRVALYSLLLLVGFEIGMILSPVDVLIQSQARAVFFDYDIEYQVPDEVSWAKAGDKVRWQRMCIYWGGTMTSAFPEPLESRCRLFHWKPDGRRLI